MKSSVVLAVAVLELAVAVVVGAPASATCPEATIVVSGSIARGARVIRTSPADLSSHDAPEAVIPLPLHAQGTEVLRIKVVRTEGDGWIVVGGADKDVRRAYDRVLARLAFSAIGEQTDDVEVLYVPPVPKDTVQPVYRLRFSQLVQTDHNASVRIVSTEVSEGQCFQAGVLDINNVVNNGLPVVEHIYPPGVGDEVMRGSK